MSIRWRLTLAWGGLFAAFGASLLLLVAFLVRAELDQVPNDVGIAIARQLDVGAEGLDELDDDQIAALLVQLADREALDVLVAGPLDNVRRQVSVTTSAALVLLALLSGGIGWFVSGRMLAPVRAITTTARRIGQSDLGERIAAEGAYDELHELADALDDMLGRLEAAFDAQRTFAADASHELRTPLTLIRAEIDVTLADPDATPDEIAEALTSIRHALTQSESLIDRLLELARAETVHHRQPVDLAELVTTAVTSELDHHPAHELTIDRPAFVAGDPTLLASLVDNLIRNAARHRRAGTPVHVTVRQSPAATTLEVVNDGPHLEPEQLERLTHRFYRPDPSRTRTTGGNGLGLAIVAAIVRGHDGSLTLEAPPTGGLHVSIRLPS